MSINFDEYNNIISMFFKKSTELQDKPYLWKKHDNDFLMCHKKLNPNQIILLLVYGSI